jgi:hypothetical protein
VADAYLFTVTNWARLVKLDLADFPNVLAFQARVAARPAVQAAMTAEGLLKEPAEQRALPAKGRGDLRCRGWAARASRCAASAGADRRGGATTMPPSEWVTAGQRTIGQRVGQLGRRRRRRHAAMRAT